MHYEAKEYASPPHTCRTHRTQKMWRESLRSYASCPRPCPSVVVALFDDQRVIIVNGDKQLLSTEVQESIEKYAAEEGIMILE